MTIQAEIDKLLADHDWLVGERDRLLSENAALIEAGKELGIEIARLKAEAAALRERVRRLERSFDIAPASWERLRSLLSDEHTHGDGMNECAICDEPLTDAASREIEGLRERIRLLEHTVWHGCEQACLDCQAARVGLPENDPGAEVADARG